MLKKPLITRIGMIVLIFAADLLWSITLIYKWKQSGMLLSVQAVSGNIFHVLTQHIAILLVEILLFFSLFFLLKKDFLNELYLRVSKKGQIIAVTLLVCVLLGMTAYGLFTRENKVAVLYSLWYYTFFIAFAEEFTFRGAFPYLLKNETVLVRYLVPNILFASAHIFNYSGWGILSGPTVFRFIFSDLLGLFTGGCVFQLLKEKSGTLWIPILIHAIMDYSVIFSYGQGM